MLVCLLELVLLLVEIVIIIIILPFALFLQSDTVVNDVEPVTTKPEVAKWRPGILIQCH